MQHRRTAPRRPSSPFRTRSSHIAATLLALTFSTSTLAQVAPTPVDPALIAQADQLEKRWGDQYLKYDDAAEIARLDAATAKLLPLLNDEGRFTDLEYGPLITGRDGGKGWGEHLLRTVDLFTAWRLPRTRAHGDRDVAQKAARALDTYLATPFDRNDTWGFGHPYADLLENNRIGRICLFARTDPTLFPQPRVEKWAAHILDRALLPVFDYDLDPERKRFIPRPGIDAGANLLWAVRGELVPFLVSSDQSLRIRAIDAYMNQVWNSQTIISPKGPLGQIERLTVDGMLGEHSAPAVGSYGEWYINAVVEYRDLIRGINRWEMPEKLNAFWIDVLLDGVLPCYQGAVDPALSNPLVWLNSRRNGNFRLNQWLSAFSASSPHRADEIKKVLAWQPGVTDFPFPDRSIKYYYTADYMTKHYPKWMVSLRAVSQRTHGMETFAQKEPNRRWAIESVLLPLGMCIVRRDTREYQDDATKGVWTAMDFARLPGQTTRHVTSAQLAAAWNRDASGYAVRMVFGSTPFSGGVTAGQTGVMGWWQSRFVQVDVDRPAEHKVTDLSTSGIRATFFLPDAVVHLGTEFDVRHDTQPTYTNLDQRASAGQDILVGIGDSVRTLPKGTKLSDPAITWVWYDGVGYLPPADGIKTVQDALQPGEPAKQIFSLYADHGRENRNLSFEWAVLPGVTAADMPILARNRSWRVLSNSIVQAVEIPATGWTGVVFHRAGSVTALGRRITVDRPCLAIFQRDAAGTITATLADPLQTDDEIRLTIADQSATIRFPGFPHRGASVSTTLRPTTAPEK